MPALRVGETLDGGEDGQTRRAVAAQAGAVEQCARQGGTDAVPALS
jgi:hypothetical protein